MGAGVGAGVGVGNKFSVGVCVFGLVFVVVLARLYFLRTVSLSSLFNGALIKRACCWCWKERKLLAHGLMEWDDSVEYHGPDLRAPAVAEDAQQPSIEWVDVGCLQEPQPSVLLGDTCWQHGSATPLT